MARCHLIPRLQGYVPQVEAPRCSHCPRSGGEWTCPTGGAPRIRSRPPTVRQAGMHAPILQERQLVLLGPLSRRPPQRLPLKDDLVPDYSCKPLLASEDRIYGDAVPGPMISFFSFTCWVSSSVYLAFLGGGIDKEGGFCSVINIAFSQMQGVHTPFGG
jgi:hypothetical protein